MKQRIIKAAIQAARKSRFKFRVGAVLYEGNHVASSGYNDPYTTHPKSPKPYKNKCAEFEAVLPWISWGDRVRPLKKYSIYVHRLKKDGSPGLAKPCEHCYAMLIGMGMKEKNIHYSVG